MDLTNKTFDKEIAKGVALVDFWAPWCGPCKMMAPTIEQLAKELHGKVKVAKVNVDEEQELSSKFGIMSIPTLMIFKDGKPIASRAGAVPKGSVMQWLEPYM
jgi:thioredoxin 1